MLDRLRDVFSSFQKHEVRYVTIRGVAAILHGVPRATFDLDILIEASPENAGRLLRALEEAGFGTASLATAEDILSSEITVFEDRVRLDVQTYTPGLLFQDAWERRDRMTYRGQEFWVVCRDDLIASKLASGRPVDREDARLLQDDGSPRSPPEKSP